MSKLILPPETYYEDPARDDAVNDMREEWAEKLKQRSRRDKLDVVIEYQEEELQEKLIECFSNSPAEIMLNDRWITEATLDGILDNIIIDYSL